MVGAKTLHEGFINLLQLGGLGRLKPNIVLLGYKENWTKAPFEEVSEYETLIADTMYHNRGVLVLRDRKNALQAYSTETNGKSLPNDIRMKVDLMKRWMDGMYIDK